MMVYLRALSLVFFFISSETIVAKPLPAAAFFSKPEALSLRLRPDGDRVLYLQQDGDEQNLVLLSPSTGAKTVLLNTGAYSEKEASIRSLLWLGKRYVAVQFSELREGIENLLDTKVSQRLLILDTQAKDDAPRKLLSVRTSGFLVHPLQSEPGSFLYAKSGFRSNVYKINIADLSPDKAVLGKLDKIDGGQFIKKM